MRKEARLKDRTLSLNTVSFIQRFPLKVVWSLIFLVRGGLCSCLWHTSVVSSEKKKNQFQKEESHQNQPVLSARLCSADPWWSFQVAHKLAHNNSRSHRNYILLTVRSFTCVATVSVYNAWTRPEPAVGSSGLRFLGRRALCLFGSLPWMLSKILS